tara:strand:+ start:253 stop:438 length:186 start_codon:yes stop_codon:yes gene_type:complete
MNDNLIDVYEELKKLVETLQIDIVKNAGGNKSAGVRARKGLREVKKIAAEIVKSSLSADKE